MLLKELTVMEGLEIYDATLRYRFNALYMETELLAYIIFKTDVVKSFAFIFEGLKVWYAVIDGERTSPKNAMNFIDHAIMEGYLAGNIKKKLGKKLFLEEL